MRTREQIVDELLALQQVLARSACVAVRMHVERETIRSLLDRGDVVLDACELLLADRPTPILIKCTSPVLGTRPGKRTAVQ